MKNSLLKFGKSVTKKFSAMKAIRIAVSYLFAIDGKLPEIAKSNDAILF